MRHLARLTLPMIFLAFFIPVCGSAAPASAVDPQSEVRGTVRDTIDADQTRAEQIFAEADAAIYFPSLRRVRSLVPGAVVTAFGKSPEAGSRTLREFEDEIERDFPHFRSNAHGPYLLKKPAAIGSVNAEAQAESIPAAPLATVFTDSFENGMTNWTLDDNTLELYSWGATTCEARTGTHSADAMRGGVNNLTCSDAYGANVKTTMTHKNCEALAGASQAWLDAYIHTATESGADTLGFFYTDATGQGYGSVFSGTWSAWFHIVFNLKQWYHVGDLTAASCPKLMIQFSSNATVQSGFGARVDDITIGNAAPGFLTASITATPSSGAVPLTVNFTPTVAGATSSAAYQWSFGDAASTTASTPAASFTYTAPGDYWARLRIDDTNVRAYTYALIRATAAGTCSVACTATAPATVSAGSSALFQATATATGCSGTASYAWDFGDMQVSVQQNASHTYTAPGTYAWRLTSVIGGTSCTKSGTITVTSPTSGSRTVRRRVVSPPSGTGDQLASATIGAAGGSVSGGGLTLTFPAGALATASTITLRKAAGTSRQPVDVSDTYSVGGLPARLLRDVTVDIDVSGSSLAAGEKYYIAADAAVYLHSVPSNQADAVNMIPVAAAVSGTQARITLPSTWSMPAIASASPAIESAGAKPNAYNGEFKVKAEKFIPYQTDHFYALYYESEASRVSTILNLLESHYQKLTGLGFSLDCRIDSATKQFRRIRVELNDLGTAGPQKEPVLGAHVSPKTGSDPCGTNWLFTSDYLDITSLYPSTDPAVGWTAGHELFHLVQDIYSPGGPKANLWLKEASSIWYELTLGDPCPSVQSANQMFPWRGLFNSKNSAVPPGEKTTDLEANHGYGASYFLWHHSRSNTDPFVRIIWDLVRGGSSEVAAIQGAMGSTALSDDWREFAKQYFFGNTVGGCQFTWAGGSIDLANAKITSENSLPQSFSLDAYPLSAISWNLYLTSFKSAAALPVSISADGLIDGQTVYIYDVKTKAELTSLTKTSPKLDLTDLNDKAGTVLVLVFVDTNLPATGDPNTQNSTNKVTLNLAKQGPCIFTPPNSFRPLAEASWQPSCPGYGTSGWLSDSFSVNFNAGKVTGDTTGSNYTVSGSYDCQGNITFVYNFKKVNFPGTDCEFGEEAQSTCTVKGAKYPGANILGTCSGSRHVWKKAKGTCSSETPYDCTFPMSGTLQFHY